jgi:hypothetical protein
VSGGVSSLKVSTISEVLRQCEPSPTQSHSYLTGSKAMSDLFDNIGKVIKKII